LAISAEPGADVADVDDHAADRGLVDLVGGDDLEMAVGAVGLAQARDVGGDAAAWGGDLAQEAVQRHRVLGMGEGGQRLAVKHARGIAEDALHRRALVGQHAGGIEHGDRIGGVLHQRAEAALAGAQALGLLGGAHCEALVDHRRGQAEEQHDEGRDRDRDAEQGRRQAVAEIAGMADMRAVARRRHAGEVHAADRSTHDQRAAGLRPQGPQVEGEPQRNHRGDDGDRGRQGEQERVVADRRAHAHRGHAGVVHGRDAAAHEQAAEHQALHPGAARPHDREADPGEQDREHQRDEGQADVVLDRNAELEGQHGDEVHRPDAAPHGNRGGDQPDGARHRGRRLAIAVRDAERGERGKDADRDREQHQAGIV
jgi:hypothetical protein